ncbi:amino acid ABC transporter permease [Achromobacter marplatensis]|jgi:polar amino acid transport system permease protein|uniref:Amino acid ABC transporter membrane protein 1 (PAAT family) n=1 Tax=Achromobacter marplatensis TaxID=470868 RepID=A0ABX9GJA3_9BURK|nr:amino acid ABC transporter permease [Achromobacter marplatensis]EJO31609.1 amino ABC transporter permease, 3-TM region, His/Glu/Gln/Arg/opine family domain-containing protein 11 [Achromobacter marplatensis]OWT72140.1 amino acid ABC transporter permease [Achromobacter marplatensis]RBP24588.1 amino acid ABC transporter membrane protein 1 (PAAT family) [Achromobacter marplatensis]CAB3625818.1 Glutamate/aspartate import permease protein GltJ [Achromobacter marplatensis]
MSLLDASQYQLLASGMLVTVQLFLVAWVMAFTIAVTLVVVRATNLAPCRWVVDAYVEYHRNVPLLVQVLFWYFGMPELLPEGFRMWLYEHNAEMSLAAIALALGSAAYIAEDIRSGLRAIPGTQFEAARALGASYLQCMRFVIVPQAVRISIPPLVGRALLLFKNTSVAMAIGVMELTYQAREIENETYRTFATFGAATIMYLLGSFLIMAVGSRIYARYRLNRGGHGA